MSAETCDLARRCGVLRLRLESKLNSLLFPSTAATAELVRRQCDEMAEAESTRRFATVFQQQIDDGVDCEPLDDLLTFWTMETMERMLTERGDTMIITKPPQRARGGACDYVAMPLERLPLPVSAALWSRANHRTFPNEFKLSVRTMLLCCKHLGYEVNDAGLDGIARLAAPKFDRARLRYAPYATAAERSADTPQLRMPRWQGMPRRFWLARYKPEDVKRVICSVALQTDCCSEDVVSTELRSPSPYYDTNGLACWTRCSFLIPLESDQPRHVWQAMTDEFAVGKGVLMWVRERFEDD